MKKNIKPPVESAALQKLKNSPDYRDMIHDLNDKSVTDDAMQRYVVPYQCKIAKEHGVTREEWWDHMQGMFAAAGRVYAAGNMPW